MYPSFRHINTVTVIVATGWPIGQLILVLEAYLIRDHFTLQLVSHVPIFLVIIVIFLGIPESTRWLISKNMHEQARKQVLRIATINKTTVPENLLTIGAPLSDRSNNKNTGKLFTNPKKLNLPFTEYKYVVYKNFKLN